MYEPNHSETIIFDVMATSLILLLIAEEFHANFGMLTYREYFKRSTIPHVNE